MLKTSEEQSALMTEVEKLWLTGKALPRPASRCSTRGKRPGI